MNGSSRIQTVPIRTFSNEVAPLASNALDRWVLRRIQQSIISARLRFQLWDGFELRPPDGSEPIATIVIKNRRALLAWIADAELNFAEAYMFGAVEVRGDLVAMLEAVYRAWPVTTHRESWLRRGANTLRAARENVHSHYDLGNDFYRLWLDRQMLYTCAYFPTPDTALEDAQIAKMDLVCRKLRLRPGDRVFEAGCGWGALALHMAKHYGAHVRAFNISPSQIAFARERAAREGLTGRAEFIEDDYRNISGACDAFVSVGMLEHVGLPDFPALGHVIDRTLVKDGRGLLHFIGRNQPSPLNPWIRRQRFARCPSTCSSRTTSRSPTSRTSACTTRRRSITGCTASRRRPRRSPACSTTPSSARGGCTSPVRGPRSRPDRCSSSRWCSRAARPAPSHGYV